MRRKLCAAIMITMLFGATPSYAIFDIMAAIQSQLEFVKNIKNKVQEVQKKIHEAKTRAVQGFETAKNCYRDPMRCDVAAMKSLSKDAPNWIKSTIKDINVMPEATALKSGDLSLKAEKGLAKSVIDGYIYVRSVKGEGKIDGKGDIERTEENRRHINAVAADDIATLFAKSVAVRQSIYSEDGSLYQYKFKNNNIDEILRAQSVVGLATQYRLNRILELRAYMVGGPSTAEMVQHNRYGKEE